MGISGINVRVCKVKHLDARVIEIDVLQIIKLLQNKMAGIKEDVAARMIAGALEKHFERHAVVQVFARMNLEAEIHSSSVKLVQNGLPARGQFVEGGFDPPRGHPRPRV